MKIIIATENKAKNQAVTEVFEQVFDSCSFVGSKAASGVSEQPLTEAEGIEGAVNRAQNVFADHADADYCVGLEGYVDTNAYGMFLAGAVAVVNNKGEVGVGISAKMQLPEFMKQRIEQGEELGPIVKELMDDVEGEIRHGAGTNGILSKGLYNRVDEFKDATKCALARFVSPELYHE